MTVIMPAGGEKEGSEMLPHVLLVVDQFPKALGGGERSVLRLAELLPECGFRASILTFAIDAETQLPNPIPCPIYLLPIERTYDFRAIRAGIEFVRFLNHQHIAIVQTFFESSDLWAGLLTKLAGAKLIWSRRDMGILRSRKHAIAYRLMANAPDSVFAVSEQVRRHCIEVDRIDSNLVVTIHNGINLAQWGGIADLIPANGKIVIATIGNIRRVKGHDVLIRAARFLASRIPGLTFEIAGDVLEPGYFQELQNLIEELSLNNVVHFVGTVTNLRKYLAGIDIFVLPSRSEGFSNAILEAMAASVPIVATAVGGNEEAVKDGVTGYIVPKEDPCALADAIGRLLADPYQAKVMGEAGRQMVVESFTTEGMMNKISAKYRQLLQLSAPIV